MITRIKDNFLKKKKERKESNYPMNLRTLPESSLMGAIVRRFQKGEPSFL